jgi:hypothetical protein
MTIKLLTKSKSSFPSSTVDLVKETGLSVESSVEPAITKVLRLLTVLELSGIEDPELKEAAIAINLSI